MNYETILRILNFDRHEKVICCWNVKLAKQASLFSLFFNKEKASLFINQTREYKRNGKRMD